MTPDKWLSLGQTALELGLISSLTVLSLFLSYTMLNVCDLSTDGCFTLGAAVGAMAALQGHPLMPVEAMPSTRDFWKIIKMIVAGTMDRVDMAKVAPISEPEEGSLKSCRARATGRMLARFTYSKADR